MNQELLSMSAEDNIARKLQGEQISQEIDNLRGKEGITDDILQNLIDQQSIAYNMSSLTEGQKKQLDAQLEVYDGMKNTVGGILDTLSLLTRGPAAAFGMALVGAGFAAESVGANIRKFGGFIDTAQISALGLGFVFEGAEDTLKSLSSEFGGMKDISFATQLNTNLMATNMGISGEEAASVVGSFARLNGMSMETAMDMAATTKSMAKAAGVPVDQVMKDVANSTEAFALYGKDGGANIQQAGIYAAKLGVNMATLTGMADNLLDFESSINSELELGAMLGKNINFNRARALAFEGKIGAAVKEQLNQLGGIDAFNKMDPITRKKAAEALGVSVAELQKMASNMDKLNDDGTIQLTQFEQWKEALTAFAAGPMGSVLKGFGGMLVAGGQMSPILKDMGINLGGAVKNTAIVLKNLLGMVAGPILNGLKSVGSFISGSSVGGAVGGKLGKIKDRLLQGTSIAPTLPTQTPTPPALPSTPEAGPSSIAERMSEIDGVKLIQAAAALLILAAALFVFAKAAKEFGDDINWTNVFIGIGALALLGLVAAGLAAIGGPLIAGATAMLIASVAFLVFGIAAQQVAIGIGMFGDALNKVDIGQMAMFGLALIPLASGMAFFGLLSPLIIVGAVAMTALGVALLVLGAGLLMVGNGISALTSDVPLVVEQMSALSTINFLPILGLAASLGVLAVALSAVALSGLLALPILAGLGLIAGGFGLFGEGEGGAETTDRTGELIDEIKGLRSDLNSGKIAVYVDGRKVTSSISRIIDKVSTNSYGL
jgi:hypothetical protein